MKNLKKGDKFKLGPQYLEFDKLLSERIGLAYLLTPDGKRRPDPEDLVGDADMQICFSDVRYNDQYAEAEDYEDLL